MRIALLLVLGVLINSTKSAEPEKIYSEPILKDREAAKALSKKSKKPLLYWVGGILETKEAVDLLQEIGLQTVHVSLTRMGDDTDKHGPRVMWEGRDTKWYMMKEAWLTETAQDPKDPKQTFLKNPPTDATKKIMPTILWPGLYGGHIYTASNGVQYHTSKAKAIADFDSRTKQFKAAKIAGQAPTMLVWVGIDPDRYPDLLKKLEDYVHLYAAGAENIPDASLLFSNGDGKDEFIREDEINDHTDDNIRVKVGTGKFGGGVTAKPSKVFSGLEKPPPAETLSTEELKKLYPYGRPPEQQQSWNDRTTPKTKAPIQHPIDLDSGNREAMVHVCTPEGCYMVPAKSINQQPQAYQQKALPQGGQGYSYPQGYSKGTAVPRGGYQLPIGRRG